jgi:hypothetical protein
VIVRAIIVFAAVLVMAPHDPDRAGEAAPVEGVLAALKSSVLTDIAQVRADIAHSQRQRGGSLFDRI